MPEANQITFANKELLELLIQKAGVHEGRWFLMTNFAIAPGNYGPDPENLAPGCAVIVNHVGIARAQPNTPEAMTLDAAVVNPKKAKG